MNFFIKSRTYFNLNCFILIHIHKNLTLGLVFEGLQLSYLWLSNCPNFAVELRGCLQKIHLYHFEEDMKSTFQQLFRNYLKDLSNQTLNDLTYGNISKY